jgi:sulfur-oxidizing protein SoxZ
MEADHFIKSIEITLDTDPVPYKGTFLFGPGNGRAAIAFKMRSGAGGTVKATVECSKHGRFVGTRAVRVAEGGCSTPPESTAHDRPKNAQVRLPEPIRAGQIVDVRARVEHNSDTGLRLRDGKFVREAREFYIKQVLVSFDGQPVSEFRLSAAASPNPLIRFPIRATRSGTLTVAFIDNEGHRAEAAQALRL